MNRRLSASLKRVQAELMAAHGGTRGSPSACAGREREAVVRKLICQSIPPAFRVGTGNIIDKSDHETGEVDIVVEYSMVPRLTGEWTSQYLAEGVACVVEVKSDLKKQWKEVVDTASKVSVLVGKHDVRTSGGVAGHGEIRVPMLVVGYAGWSTTKSIRSRLSEKIAGILVIEHSLYVGAVPGEPGRVVEIHGPGAFWGFMCAINSMASSLLGTSFSALDYLDEPVLVDHTGSPTVVGWLHPPDPLSGRGVWRGHFLFADDDDTSISGSREAVEVALRTRFQRRVAAGTWPPLA